MTKRIMDLEADTTDSAVDYVTVESAIRKTRAEKVTELVNEWLAKHNIDATYTHKLDSHFLNTNVAEGIVFANAKEEFKYHLLGGDKALQEHFRKNMFGIFELIRNVMPGVIAKDIVGVQPMIGIGTGSSIFKLKTRYGK